MRKNSPSRRRWCFPISKSEHYQAAWQFTAEAPGAYTVTMNADEFMRPMPQVIWVWVARVYLPLIFRNF